MKLKKTFDDSCSRNTSKAEYMAETQAMKEAIWLCCFLSEIGYFHDNNVVII